MTRANSESGLMRSRELASSRVEGEQMKEYEWEFYSHTKLEDYEKSFSKVLRKKFYEEVEQRKLQNLPTYAADIMGPGKVLHELSLTKGLAVTLADGRFMNEKQQDDDRNIDRIAGDILAKKTRLAVDKWVKQNTDGRGLSLVMVRPLEGLDYLTDDPKLWYELLKYFWKKLDKEDGLLYAQIPLSPESPKKNWELVNDWVKKVEKGHGDLFGLKYDPGIIDIEGMHKIASLRLVRTKNSPESLPKFIDN